MSQLERIFAFHQEVQAKRYPNFKFITDNFEVSEVTAWRDIAYLRDRLGAPLEFDRKKKGYYYKKKFSLPIDKTELILLLYGLIHKITENSGLDMLPEIKGIKKKLSHFVSLKNKRIDDLIYFEKPETEPVSSNVIGDLIKAMQEGKVVRFLYQKPNGTKSLREVEPCRLIYYNWRWFLIGYCHLRRSIRIFNLSRIEEKVERVEKKITKCSEKINNLLTKSFGIYKTGRTKNVKILFKGELAAVIERQFWHPQQKVKRTKNGVILTVPVADWTEIKMKILQYGSEAEVLAPKELREIIKQEARMICDIYR